MTTTLNTPRKTTQQRRAEHAWKAIEEVLQKYPLQTRDGKDVPDDNAKVYGRLVRDLPTRILASGLGQALAFRWAKRDKQTEALLQHLGDWLLDKRQNIGSTKPVPQPQELLRKLVAKDSDAMFLRLATEEAIAYLNWLKRFAEAHGLTEGDNS
jgi:CRISPR-associated protein Cmr5